MFSINTPLPRYKNSWMAHRGCKLSFQSCAKRADNYTIIAPVSAELIGGCSANHSLCPESNFPDESSCSIHCAALTALQLSLQRDESQLIIALITSAVVYLVHRDR